MAKVNIELCSYSCQSPVSGIKKCFRSCVVLWSEPFSFHNTPKSLHNVQMGRIRRNIEEKESPFFPYGTHLFYFLITVYTCIVKYDKCLSVELERESVEKINNFLCIDRFTGAEPFEAVIPVNHSKDVKPFGFFDRNVDIFSGKLPPVRDISFCADMGLVTIEEVDCSFFKKYFKFLQLLGLIRIELRRGLTLRTFSYTSISCANADKKRLNVDSLASLPEAFCQASLAARTLCRSDSMALRTASSSEQSMMALRPCPGRVYNPLIPWFSKRLTQLPTVWAVISVCLPTWDALRPSALSSMARQRIRKQWVSPVRKPIVSCRRSESFKVNFLIFICLAFLFETKIRQFIHM